MKFLPFSYKLYRSISCFKQEAVFCLAFKSKLNITPLKLDQYIHTGKHTHQKKMSDFILPSNTPFTLLDCQEAFHLLTEKEKLYSHYLSRAYWMGALIVPIQTSLESPLIFSLLHRLFQLQPVKELKQIAVEQCHFSEDDFTAFLIYTCGVLANLGNYKGFGDTKIVPNLEKDKFEKLVLLSKFCDLHPVDAKTLLSNCLESIFSLHDKEQQLGFPFKGTTKYLSKNFVEEDNEIVTQYLKEKKLEPANSRLIKSVDESGITCYEIRLASVLGTDDEEDGHLLTVENVNSHKFSITRGDYSKVLKLVNENLQLAKGYAANEKEEQMIKKYIESFHTGSIDAHKDGSRVWVQDKEPIVETYVGFIETYKDPAQVRGEFEGFVAMVNKPMSAKFAALVNLSEELISLLPWPSTFEKDKFMQPDFSSLDVLTFACNDVPIGINIPNYDEIRECDGFKNVTLGNVIRTKAKDPPNYLSKDDQELFMIHREDALEVQTGLHELLGHGSGKLFKKNEDGSFNFDAEQVLNYETNQKISSWYEEGETYSSVFSTFSSAYEECRAESIGMYLSTVPEVLKIFGFEGDKANDVMYVNWIDSVYAGIEALKCYDPKTGSWLQAHGQSAYVILQVLLECEGNFIKLQKIQGEDGKPDLLFTMDRSKIMSHGKPCMESFLKKLQLYKAIADKDSAKKMFDRYSEVTSESKYPFLDYREIVMDRKKPRKLIVQPNTFLEDGKVKLKIYKASPEGMIESCIDRYQGINIDEMLEELWAKDKIHFS